MELQSRKDIPAELTWDLSSIYATEEELHKDMESLETLSGRLVQNYRGRLTTPENINACLDDLREIYRLLSLGTNYCELAVSVDYYNTDRKSVV